MKLTELKEIYEKKSKEIRITLKETDSIENTKITTVYTIPYQYGNKLKIKPTPESKMTHWRHLQLEVFMDGYWTTGYYRFEKDELNYYKEQLMCAVDYWRNYCKIKGFDGFSFFAHKEVKEELCNMFLEILANEMKQEHIELQKKVLQHTSYHFLGGVFPTAYTEVMDNFFTTKTIIEEVMDDNSLINFSSGNNIWDLFSPNLYLSYCGETIRLQHDEEFSKLFFCFMNSKQFIGEAYETSIDAVEITSLFDDLKERLKLANVLNPPMTNFKLLMDKVFIGIKEDLLPPLFDELHQQFGSWEEVEQESKELLTKYTKNIRENLVTEMKDKQSRELMIFKLNTEKWYYHFVSIRDIKEYENSYYIVASQEEYPEEVKNMVLEYFIPNYK